jgi:hypothetical protein
MSPGQHLTSRSAAWLILTLTNDVINLLTEIDHVGGGSLSVAEKGLKVPTSVV